MSITVVEPQSAPQLILGRMETMTLSDNTRVMYLSDARGFIQWLSDDNGHYDPDEAVEVYIDTLREEGLSPATINKKLSAIKKFFETGGKMKIFPEEVVKSVKTINGLKNKGQRKGKWLTLDEMKALVDQPDDTPMGLRDKALLSLMLSSGLRVSEVSELCWSNLVEQNGTFYLQNVRGKGNKVRTTVINTRTYEALDKYRKVRYNRTDVPSDDRIFVSLSKSGEWGNSVTTRGIYNIIKKYAGDVAAHDLRRSFARYYYEESKDIQTLSKLLGHSSVAVTEIYLGSMVDFEEAARHLEW